MQNYFVSPFFYHFMAGSRQMFGHMDGEAGSRFGASDGFLTNPTDAGPPPEPISRRKSKTQWGWVECVPRTFPLICERLSPTPLPPIDPRPCCCCCCCSCRPGPVAGGVPTSCRPGASPVCRCPEFFHRIGPCFQNFCPCFVAFSAF